MQKNIIILPNKWGGWEALNDHHYFRAACFHVPEKSFEYSGTPFGTIYENRPVRLRGSNKNREFSDAA